MLKSESYCSREKTFSSSGGNLITKCIFQKQNFYVYVYPSHSPKWVYKKYLWPYTITIKILLWLSEASRHRCSFSLYGVTLLGRTGEIFLNKVSYEISCFLTKCPWLKLSHSGMLFWDSFFYPAFPKRILIRGFLERCFAELWPSKEHHSVWWSPSPTRLSCTRFLPVRQEEWDEQKMLVRPNKVDPSHVQCLPSEWTQAGASIFRGRTQELWKYQSENMGL